MLLTTRNIVCSSPKTPHRHSTSVCVQPVIIVHPTTLMTALETSKLSILPEGIGPRFWKAGSKIHSFDRASFKLL